MVYLPSGNAALTRRSTLLSSHAYPVFRFASSRKRSERIGTLVEPDALTTAKEQCVQDEANRSLNREIAAIRREKDEEKFVQAFSETIRHYYPGCTEKTARTIAEHACAKHSGRVGRSAAAKVLSEAAVALAVRAHIRHANTKYHELLSSGGFSKEMARERVQARIDEIVEEWRKPRGFVG